MGEEECYLDGATSLDHTAQPDSGNLGLAGSEMSYCTRSPRSQLEK